MKLATPRRMFPLPLAAALLTVLGLSAQAQVEQPDSRQFFETNIRPVLAEHCLKCHNEERQKGGLRLDSIDPMLEGGDSGPAIVPGHPEDSLLIEAVRHDGLTMPPKGTLSPQAIADLTRWVEVGAPWPTDVSSQRIAAGVTHSPLTDEDRAFWSFQPLTNPVPPELPADHWSRNDVDPFILLRLHEAGLNPAPEADRPTLIRRLSFDLTGLPPTPQEVEAFVSDTSPQAYEHLVDRLLESPAYGERWGRHWLDLVRYSESDGHRQDAYRPNAWRYRDYVIAALNDDLPYNQFLTEQLAGDELDPDSPRMKVATSYYRHGPYEFNQRNVPGQWADILNEVTDLTGEVFLGLSIGCARCHDHKFDPILQDDYFRLQAFFTPLRHRDDQVLATPEQAADDQVAAAAWHLLTADLRDQIATLEKPYRDKAAYGALTKFPEETQAILLKHADDRSPYEQQLAELAFRQYTEEWNKIGTYIKGDDKKRWDALQKELAAFDHLKPAPAPTAFTVSDIGLEAPPTRIPGDPSARDIPPGYLAVLNASTPAIESTPETPNSTGRRLTLARWLCDPENPLSNRVIVNRLWQYHFGRGLVATSSDYGRLGEPPSHPELLDYLAQTFIQQGRSFKAMHRLLLCSATYRQSSVVVPSAQALIDDPENRLLWHANRRRLEAEEVRDSLLAVTGELDPLMGGPSISANNPRRAIYLKLARNSPDSLLDAFDTADGFFSTPQRNRTTTSTQALLLLNNPWVLDRAHAFAQLLEAAHPENEAARVTLAYHRALGRAPLPDEVQNAIKFLAHQQSLAAENAQETALVDFCHALLNSNEFLHVD